MFYTVRRISQIVLIGFLICAMTIIPVQELLPVVHAQENLEERIDEGEELFYSGQFSKAESILRACLESDQLSSDQKMRVYRLLGLSSISRGFENQAREAIQSLLDIVPDYQPNPDQDPPQFIRMVEDVRQQQDIEPGQPPSEVSAQDQEQPPEELEQLIQEEQQQKSGRTWYYVAGGVLAGVAAAVVIGFIIRPDDNFPMPPGRPQ